VGRFIESHEVVVSISRREALFCSELRVAGDFCVGVYLKAGLVEQKVLEDFVYGGLAEIQ
ncbi:hypothetical protein RYX36_031640, partial [Vicia faba]